MKLETIIDRIKLRCGITPKAVMVLQNAILTEYVKTSRHRQLGALSGALRVHLHSVPEMNQRVM